MRIKMRKVVFSMIITACALVLWFGYSPVEAAGSTPARVTGLALSHVNHNTIKISWKKAKYAKEYQIYRSTSKDGTYKRVKTTTNRSFKNTNLNTGQKYYYKVRAINDSKKGKFSVIKSFKVRLSKTKITDIESTENTVQLTIKSIQGANWYHVYRADSEDGTFVKLTSAFDLNYIDENLEADKDYYYKIRGVKKVDDGYKYGPFSEIVQIRTNPHDYVSVITAPTDTEWGFTTHTCSVCGDFYITDEVKPAFELYVIDEAKRVSDSVNSKVNANSLNFILASDMHNAAEGEMDEYVVWQINNANMHAGQGMSTIADNVDLDFCGVLGDFAWGSDTTTIKQGKESITKALSYIEKIRNKTQTVLLPGNHDSLLYSYDQNHTYLSDDEVKSMLGNYKYIDFIKQKIRVICLNTSETEPLGNISSSASAEGISGKQLEWFASALDLSKKYNAKEWGIIILSHHPLDWGDLMPAANCLQAYLNGEVFSTTHDGMNIGYNFSGRDRATIIAQFHGHVHNYKVDYIHYKSSEGEIIPTTVKRIAIPNANFYRNNEYGNNSGPEYNGIEFGESVTYNKESESAKDTAFSVVTIDKNSKKIYVYNYGAGIDRVVSYR